MAVLTISAARHQENLQPALFKFTSVPQITYKVAFFAYRTYQKSSLKSSM